MGSLAGELGDLEGGCELVVDGGVAVAMYQADGNQGEIIEALREAGCSVEVIEGANGRKGVPDLLVGRTGCGNYLLEVKRPKVKGRSSAGKLDDKQKAWHAAWRGQVATVWTVEDALRAVGLLNNQPMEEP